MSSRLADITAIQEVVPPVWHFGVNLAHIYTRSTFDSNDDKSWESTFGMGIRKRIFLVLFVVFIPLEFNFQLTLNMLP